MDEAIYVSLEKDMAALFNYHKSNSKNPTHVIVGAKTWGVAWNVNKFCAYLLRTRFVSQLYSWHGKQTYNDMGCEKRVKILFFEN